MLLYVIDFILFLRGYNTQIEFLLNRITLFAASWLSLVSNLGLLLSLYDAVKCKDKEVEIFFFSLRHISIQFLLLGRKRIFHSMKFDFSGSYTLRSNLVFSLRLIIDFVSEDDDRKRKKDEMKTRRGTMKL